MEILGLSPITVVLIICLTGVELRVYIGKIKHPDQKFNVNKMILSFFVGVIISVSMVAPVIDELPDDTDELKLLPIIAGQIIVVMKTESLSTAGQSLISSVTQKIRKEVKPDE